MSPKIQGLTIQDVDVPMELLDQNPRGGLVDIVTTMIVAPNTNLLGATLSLPSQSHPLSDTPVKVHLRREIGECREALPQSHTLAAQEIHDMKVDAASKVTALLKNQRDGFEQ